MALASAQISVGTSATQIAPPTLSGPTTTPANMLVKNKSSVDVFLGKSTVTTSNGFALGAGETLNYGGEALYGIVATGTATVHVLASDGLR